MADLPPSGSDGARTLITFQPSTPVSTSRELDGVTILEPGSPVVWFTFPGLWHDIGAFHLVDGTFTGLYANILTPVELGERGSRRGAAESSDRAATTDSWEWATTDLLLDVWLGAGAVGPIVLDREEFQAARPGLPSPLVQEAERALAGILAACENRKWPPPVVGEWPLARVLERLGRGQASSPSTSHAPQSRSTST